MSMDLAPTEISPVELKRRLDAGETPCIIDVRQPEEYALCRLASAKLTPLAELPARVQEFDPDAEIIVHCKMGGRAAQACAFLRQQGFTKVRNLTGGIMAWAAQIDPTMPKY